MRVRICSRSPASGDERGLLRERVDEIAPALGARVEPLERDERRGVLRLDLLRAAEILDRLLRLVELLVVGDGDDEQELALERGQLLLALAGRERLLVQRDERLPGVHDRRQVLERLARGRRLGALAEGLGVGVPGLLAVAELALELADAQQQRDALGGRLLAAELDALDLDETGQLLGLLVDRLEHLDGRHLQLGVAVRQIGLQGRARAHVRRVELERLAIGRHGARGIAEVLVEHGAAPELELRDGRSRRQGDLLLHDERELGPLAEALIDAIERHQRRS